MKKILSFLLVAMLLLNGMVSAVVAAGSAVKVVVSQETVQNGYATVSVSVKGNTGFRIYGITLSYVDDLELVAIEKGTLSSNGLFTKNVEDAKVAFISDELVTGDGVLFTAKFKANGNAVGDYTVGVNVNDFALSNDDKVTTTETPGSITVVCAHTQYAEVPDTKYLKTAATCNSPAVYYKSCANVNCGVQSTETFTYGEKDAANHTNLKAYAEVPATCNAFGTEAYYHCTGCDKYFSDAAGKNEIAVPVVIEKNPKNHAGGYEVRNSKPATRDEEGYTGDVYCLGCGAMVQQGEVIPANKPDFDFDHWFWWIMMLENQTYSITATAGEGGTITPDGVTNVKHDKNQTYTIKAEEGYEIASIKVDGKAIDVVNEYTFKKVRSNHTISVTFKKVEYKIPFTDVNANADYYKAVEFLYNNNIMNGVADTKFAPDMTITRGMFVTILGRLHDVDTDDYTETSFKDVKVGEYYSPYVQWAAENGIVLGYGDEIFGVDDEITIEQAVTILARYTEFVGYNVDNGTALDGYKDGDTVSAWALNAMKWAVSANVYKPTEKLNPQDPASRAQVAVMVYHCALNVLD